MTSLEAKSSLSADGPKPAGARPRSIHQYDQLAQPPHILRLDQTGRKHTSVKPLSIKVEDGTDGFVPAFLHLPPDFVSPKPGGTSKLTAAILLSGAGGGVTGPSSIYLSLASKLASLRDGIPVLRLDYRYPARNRYCTRDVLAAMSYLQDTYGLSRFVLVGWSFGGAPVFTVGGADHRVVGCATVASQTAETEGIRRLAPRPVLLMHGTGDRTLSSECSERLYAMYGETGKRRLELFKGDNHALSLNALEAETMLCEFIAECADVNIEAGEKEAVVEQILVDDGERTDLMSRGGDLAGPESKQ